MLLQMTLFCSLLWLSSIPLHVYVCICVCVCVCACVLSSSSCVWFFATLWTVTHQAPLSMGLSRQEHWSGLPGPAPGDLPHPGIEPMSPAAPALQVDSLPLSHQGSEYVHMYVCIYIYTHTHVDLSSGSLVHLPPSHTHTHTSISAYLFPHICL